MEKGNKIVLNSSSNKNRFIGLFILVIVLIAFSLSKIYMPDGRKNMTNFDTDTEINFSNVKIEVESITYNPSEQLGQVFFKETVKNIDERYKVDYSVGDENGVLMQFNVIASDYIKLEGQTHQRYVALQYAIPNKYYFINFKLEQINIQDSILRIDYRDNEVSSVTEKGNDYLKEYQDKIFAYHTFNYDDLEEERIVIESIISVTKNEIDSTTNEDELSKLNKELTEFNEKLKGVDIKLEERKADYEVLEKEYLELQGIEVKREEPLKEN